MNRKGFAPILALAIIVGAVIVLITIFRAVIFSELSRVPSTANSLNCYNPEASVITDEYMPISCMTDDDCTIEAVTRSCVPPFQVGKYLCKFQDFCGNDGYCKYSCSY